MNQHATVCPTCGTAGVILKGRQEVYAEKLKEARRLKRLGKPLATIARRTGLSYGTVYSWKYRGLLNP